MTSTTLSPGNPEDVGLSTTQLDKVRVAMQGQIDAGLSPTSAIVLARHGTVVMAEGFGTQKPGGPPTTVDHIFPLASGTKPITAATLLSLAEDGLVGLNEPASVHIPELDQGGLNPPDLVHFLTHTAGIDPSAVEQIREVLLAEMDFERPEGRDLLCHILLEPALRGSFNHPPYEVMQYDNGNYSIIGEVIRRVTGLRLHDVMHQRIFDPLGLQHSTVILPDSLAGEVIERPPGIPHSPDGDEPLVVEGPLFSQCDDGGVGGYMSPMDMAVFMQMILNGGEYGDARVLSQASVRAMTTNRIPGVKAEAFGQEVKEAGWGYGLSVGMAEATWAYFRGGLSRPGLLRHGGAGGIRTWIDPETEIVGVLFEVITESSPEGIPRSWAAHRIEDMVAAAIRA